MPAAPTLGVPPEPGVSAIAAMALLLGAARPVRFLSRVPKLPDARAAS